MGYYRFQNWTSVNFALANVSHSETNTHGSQMCLTPKPIFTVCKYVSLRNQYSWFANVSHSETNTHGLQMCLTPKPILTVRKCVSLRNQYSRFEFYHIFRQITPLRVQESLFVIFPFLFSFKIHLLMLLKKRQPDLKVFFPSTEKNDKIWIGSSN